VAGGEAFDDGLQVRGDLRAVDRTGAT